MHEVKFVTIYRYMHDPSRGHWEVVRWIMRYIKSAVDVGFVSEKDVGGKLECTSYVNSEGILISNGPLQGMCCTLQSTVALSMTEAKFMTLTEAVKEAI